MARFQSFIHSGIGCALGTFFLVGCQSQTSMVGELPSPNFSGPAFEVKHDHDEIDVGIARLL